MLTKSNESEREREKKRKRASLLNDRVDIQFHCLHLYTSKCIRTDTKSNRLMVHIYFEGEKREKHNQLRIQNNCIEYSYHYVRCVHISMQSNENILNAKQTKITCSTSIAEN